MSSRRPHLSLLEYFDLGRVAVYMSEAALVMMSVFRTINRYRTCSCDCYFDAFYHPFPIRSSRPSNQNLFRSSQVPESESFR